MQVEEILALIKAEQEKREEQATQQADSARYLNELNTVSTSRIEECTNLTLLQVARNICQAWHVADRIRRRRRAAALQRIGTGGSCQRRRAATSSGGRRASRGGAAAARREPAARGPRRHAADVRRGARGGRAREYTGFRGAQPTS